MLKEKYIQMYYELFKIHIEKFNQTRQIEWKGNFALWGLLVGLGAATMKLGCLSLQKTPFTQQNFVGVSWIIFFGHMLWLLKVHLSELKDLDVAYYCRKMLDTNLDFNLKKLNDFGAHHAHCPCGLILKCLDWTGIWVAGELGITALILFVIYKYILS